MRIPTRCLFRLGVCWLRTLALLLVALQALTRLGVELLGDEHDQASLIVRVLYYFMVQLLIDDDSSSHAPRGWDAVLGENYCYISETGWAANCEGGREGGGGALAS